MGLYKPFSGGEDASNGAGWNVKQPFVYLPKTGRSTDLYNHLFDLRPMPTPRIRQARPGDRAVWLRLRHSLWPRCSDHKHDLETDQLLKSGGVVFVAEAGHNDLVGFAEVSIRQDHVDGASICPVPYLEAWFVEASFRKQGVGRSLIDAVEHWVTLHGYTELGSDAEMENSLSIRLHKSLGFSEIDRNITFLKKLKPRTTKNVEPGAAPNGGPARSSDSSSASGGPPSVS
jgi:aminoglycoside 6'-N-acetyltransferase I